jgi:hypothetical protein
MKEIKHINKFLKTFGCAFDGRPNFRIVWSSDRTEKRYGTFHKYYGHIYLGEWSGIQERKMYEDIGIYDKWVLEELEFSYDQSIIGSENGHYEPKWVFRTRDNEYQKPIMEAVEFLMQCKFAHVVRRDARAIDNEQKLKSDKNIKNIMEMLDIGHIVTALHAKSGISLSGAYKDHV